MCALIILRIVFDTQVILYYIYIILIYPLPPLSLCFSGLLFIRLGVVTVNTANLNFTYPYQSGFSGSPTQWCSIPVHLDRRFDVWLQTDVWAPAANGWNTRSKLTRGKLAFLLFHGPPHLLAWLSVICFLCFLSANNQTSALWVLGHHSLTCWHYCSNFIEGFTRI